MAIGALAASVVAQGLLFAWSVRGYVMADRATFLARTISEGLNCLAFVLVCIAVWAVPMFIGRRRRLAR